MMTRDETLIWFKNSAIPVIESNHGLYGTYYYVYEDNDGYGNYDPYSFNIGYQAYSCTVDTDDGCNDCPYRTLHGDCGEYHLYINDNGSIYYENTDKTYNSDQFDELLSEFY